jgi:hypothetical protein
MLKSLVRASLRRFGYRLCRIESQDFQPNPRIDQSDIEASRSVIERITKGSDGSMTWERSQRYFSPERINFYYSVMEVLETNGLLDESPRVLDVGVYFGYLLRILHRFHPSGMYSGTDTHDTRLAIARELCPWATIWHGTIDDLEPDQRYDIVVLTEVLEHLVDPGMAVEKLTKIGKVLMLTVPDGRVDTTAAMQFNSDWGSYRGHVNFWSPESWRFWLERELPNCKVETGRLPTKKLFALVETARLGK